MIKTVFTFFQVQIEGFRRHAIEFLKAAFGIRPETFNAVDVNIADGENLLRVIDPQMFAVTDINQTVVSAPAVRMNHRVERNLAANNVLQRFLCRIGNNLGINFAISFVNSKDDSFTARAASALAANSPCAKVRLVNFDFATAKRRNAFRFLSNAMSDFQINSINALVRHISEPSGFIGGQIKRKIPNNLPCFSLRYFSAPILSV